MLAKARVRLTLVAAAFGAIAACVPPFSTDDSEILSRGDAGASGGASAFVIPDAGRTTTGPNDASNVTDAGVDTDGEAPGPVVLTGATDRILLSGIVVTPDTAFDGEVLVEGSTITCVAPSGACGGLPAANGATLVLTNGIIAPGMIDTHNHVLFDIFDDSDWKPSQLYTSHDQWSVDPRYQAMLDVERCFEDAPAGKPAWCPAKWSGGVANSLKCEMHKWGELKGILAGTTSMVGLAGDGAACMASVARSIDVAQNGLGTNKVRASALFPPEASSANAACAGFTSGATDAYLIHAGEGTDANALAEWATLGTVTNPDDCLYAPQTTITHGTAFTASEFTAMASAGMKLTWSPRSDVARYGTTTNIAAALDANVLLALAPDWSMDGSQNLLDEMRFADGWDDAHFGDRLKPRDLVMMTTKNAAAVVGLADRIGTIAPGYVADLVVYTPKGPDAYASILAATPKDVRMTMIGGRVVYGDLVMLATVVAPANAPCDLVDVCGLTKFVCVSEPTTSDKLNQTGEQIQKALEDALVEVDALTPGDGYSFAPLAPLAKCP